MMKDSTKMPDARFPMYLPFFLLYLTVIVFSCTEEKKPAVKIEPPATNLPGNVLATTYCSACHAFVDPKFLPKSTWQNQVLPSMGHRMGIYQGDHQPDSLFEKGIGGQIVRKALIYPENPILATADWQKIVNYYLSTAPDTVLPPVREKKITMGLKHFKYRESTYSHKPAMTTMVKILPDKRGVVFGDNKPEGCNFSFLTSKLDKDYNITLKNAPIHYYEKHDTVFLTTIGRNIFPHDAPEGALQKITKAGPEQQYKSAKIVISNMQRPVHMQYVDLNDDGREDIVACEYGNLTGKLVWYQKESDSTYTMRPIKGVAGAIVTQLTDLDKDGLIDIVALLAQGDEGMFWFKNRGNGTFEEIRLLKFLPLFGSQYFELHDFNNDGFEDILYVCGDNADLTPILKSFHGIYIYLNDGKQQFESTYFYQLNGAYKAMARDYDRDGDLDIAAISYFPDYASYPEESFIYLENTGKGNYIDYSFPQATNGRWIVMDAGDLDGDGDIDLALGSNVFFIAQGDETGLGEKWFATGPSVAILENTIK